jgi:hypothetical protein
MAKFNLLTTLILDSAGYTKGINAASKSTQQLGSKLGEAGKGLTSTMGQMGGMVGEIGGAVSSLAGAATGIGLVVAAVGLLVSALKTAKENMDLYIASTDKAEGGSGIFVEDAEKVRKKERKTARGGVRVEQEIMSKGMLDAAYLYNQIQKETDVEKKKVLQTTLDQTVAEYRTAQVELEKNKTIRNGLEGRKAGIVFEAQFRNIALETAKIEKEKEQTAKEYASNTKDLTKLKQIVISQTASEAEKNKAMADFEKIINAEQEKKLAMNDREIANQKQISILMPSMKEATEKKINELLTEREEIQGNEEKKLLKAQMLNNKLSKSAERENKRKEQEQKKQEDFVKQSLTAHQEVIIAQQKTEEEAALKTREFKYTNDVAEAKEKYKGMAGLNQMLKDLELKYQMDVANIKSDFYDKDVEEAKKKAEEKTKAEKEATDAKKEVEKKILEDKYNIIDAAYNDGTIKEKEYLKQMMDAELSNTELTEQQKLLIKSKYAKELRTIDNENLKAGLDMALQVTDKISNALNVQKDKELKAAGNNAQKKEQIEKKYAQKQKAIALARAVIATALAVTENLGVLWKAIAVGALGAIEIGTIASTKFAKGGIVSGPTNALIGEYAGAKSNPEVVAPLSKLTEMLGLGGGGEIKLRAEGGDLVAVFNYHNRKVNSYA